MIIIIFIASKWSEKYNWNLVHLHFYWNGSRSLQDRLSGQKKTRLTTPFSTISDSLSSEGYTTPGQSIRKMRLIKVMYCHT